MLDTNFDGDDYGHFGHQHLLYLFINVGHQRSKDVTKIDILSPTSKSYHQHHYQEKIPLKIRIDKTKKIHSLKKLKITERPKYTKNIQKSILVHFSIFLNLSL